VTGQQLCDGAAKLAASQYGLLAEKILGDSGIHSTSDLGNIVYLLIDSGDLEKTPTDSRNDFDNVFDWSKGLHDRVDFALEDVT
jgi:uncharacterized repeat protein (TIGR04138 family)